MCPLLHWRGGSGDHSQQLWGDAIDDIYIYGQLYDLPTQVGTGSQVPLAIQVAIAVVTPLETSYPLKQV